MLTFTLIHGYTASVHWLIQAMGEADQEQQILSLFTGSKFLVLQVMLIAVISFLITVLFLFNRIWMFYAACYSYLIQQVTLHIRQLISTEIKWILIIPFFSAVYFACTMPVSYDEAWTYLQFTSKSPLASLCYYPAPNNHVLHSLITNITRYIPFLGPLLCLRISVIIISVFAWLLCYSFIKKYYSSKISLLIVGITSMLFMSVYYSYMSRGYGLVLFFFSLSMYTAYTIIYKQDQTKHWILFGLSNVLGFFTMPSFLYPFIILNTAILLNNGFRIKKQIVCTIASLLLAGILYTPILVVNGIDSISNNQFVKPISRSEVIQKLPVFFSHAVGEITGIHYVAVLLILVLAGVMLIRNNMRFEFRLLVLFLVFPCILLIVHSVVPFARTFNYYGFILVFFALISYWKYVEKIAVPYILVAVVSIQLVAFMNFYLNIKKYEGFNITYHEINEKIIGNHSYYFNTALFETNFLFENKVHGYVAGKTTFNFPQIDIDADTVTGFDYYIIDDVHDFTNIKKPVYSDGQTNVYAK